MALEYILWKEIEENEIEAKGGGGPLMNPPIEKSEELHAIGKEIYQKFGSELEKEHYGKYVIIIPAEQCGDDKHRMLVTKQRLFRDLSYVEELKKTYPEAAPYVAFIGDSKDNPDVMRI